jgi:hypothetical protein
LFSLLLSLPITGVLADSPAHEIDPCSLPSQALLTRAKPTQIEALEKKPNIISGSAKILARCTSKNDPNLMACLSTAVRKNKNYRVLVFDSYVKRGERIYPHFSVVHYEDPNSEDHEYRYWDSPMQLWTRHVVHGRSNISSAKYATEVTLHKGTGNFSYKYGTLPSGHTSSTQWEIQKEILLHCELAKDTQ